jgi:hypothetical protein
MVNTFHCSYSVEPSVKLASLLHFAQRPGDDFFGKERPQPSPVSEPQKSILNTSMRGKVKDDEDGELAVKFTCLSENIY